MRCRMGAALAAMTTLYALAAPAAEAITNGKADTKRKHAYVGALVTTDAETGGKRLICSGTLVEPDVFLTAAHCLEGEPERLHVSFADFVGAPDVADDVPLHAGTAHAHPLYKGKTKSGPTHDLGVVMLDEPVDVDRTARLAEPGALEELGSTADDIRWRVAGYGREGFADKAFFGGGTRHFGFGAWRSMRDHVFKLDQTGSLAGTCNGDSGGPVFLGWTRTLIGVASDGDMYCRKYGINARVDTPTARAFLDDFLDGE